MSYLIKPANYKALLDLKQTELGIKQIKEFFQQNLSSELRPLSVSWRSSASLSTRIPIEESSTERSSTLSQTNRSPFRPGSPVSGLIVV